MRKLLVTLIVLIVLVVAADFAGRAIAESKAGEAIATKTPITPAPDVNIHGLSFLWQAFNGQYSHITLTSSDLTVGRLTGIDATADLFDVHFPLSDAIGGNVDNLTAGHANLGARIPASALSSALDQQNLTVTAGADGALRLGTTLAAAGQTFPVQVDLKPTVSNGTLHLKGATVVDAPAAVPSALTDALVHQVSIDLPLVGLPFPLDTATASVDGDTLVLTGAARELKIGQLVKSAG